MFILKFSLLCSSHIFFGLTVLSSSRKTLEK